MGREEKRSIIIEGDKERERERKSERICAPDAYGKGSTLAKRFLLVVDLYFLSGSIFIIGSYFSWLNL